MDRIVATSDNYLASSEVLWRYKQKVEVIPIGIEPYPFDALPESVVSSWREKLPTKFFFFIGVLRYYKGLHILIDALAVWDVPTVIVGAGPIECSLKKRAREYGLKNLIFLGAISEQDKMAVLSLSYAMLFPSHLRSEAFGISLLEGAMAEKPLVSSEIGTGTSFINIHGETGLVVEAGNPVSLRAAMMRIWNDEEFARDMGRRGRRRFEALFTARRMSAAYSSLYQELHAKDASLEFLPKVGHAKARS
jgi:rhamnosyl/mannosyltransferase